MIGTLITFEGNECAGKNTQIKLMPQQMRSFGYEVYDEDVLAEPSDTNFAGKALRERILAGIEKNSNFSVMKTFSIDREYFSTNYIGEKLSRGRLLFKSRDICSSFAYQYVNDHRQSYYYNAMLRRMNITTIPADNLIFLDVTPETSIERKRRRGGKEIFENDQNIRKQYDNYPRALAMYLMTFPLTSVSVIDGEKSISEVASDVSKEIVAYMINPPRPEDFIKSDQVLNVIPDYYIIRNIFHAKSLYWFGQDINKLDRKTKRNFLGRIFDEFGDEIFSGGKLSHMLRNVIREVDAYAPGRLYENDAIWSGYDVRPSKEEDVHAGRHVYRILEDQFKKIKHRRISDVMDCIAEVQIGLSAYENSHTEVYSDMISMDVLNPPHYKHIKSAREKMKGAT